MNAFIFMSKQSGNTSIIVAIIGGLLAIIGIIIQPIVAEYIKNKSDLISISLTNEHCYPIDYYVDGIRKASSVSEGETVSFKVKPGKHRCQACVTGTNECNFEEKAVEWNESTPMYIDPGLACPMIEIYLTNNHYHPIDCYVNGIRKAESVPKGKRVTFKIKPGNHWWKICETGTSKCNSKKNDYRKKLEQVAIDPGLEFRSYARRRK